MLVAAAANLLVPPSHVSASVAAPGLQTRAVDTSREVVVYRDTAIVRPYGSSRAEPIVAGSDDAVVVTYNWAASVSSDGGRTFRTIYPDKLFPKSPFAFSKGNCCDNWVTQDPARHLIFWALMYLATGNGPNDENGLRLAVAHGAADVAADRWKTYDITMSDLGFGPGHVADHPMVAVSSNYLYLSTAVSTTVIGPQRRPGVVVRMPLSQLAADVRPDMQVVRPDGAHLLLPVSGATSTMYFGCYHYCVQNSIRVLVWPEAEPAPTIWRAIPAGNGPASSARCPDPSGVDPCGGADPNHEASAVQPVQAGWLAGGELGFMWHSAQTSDRPYPFTRVVILDPDTLGVRSQPDIWSASHALLFPAVAVNARGHLGGTIAALGGDTYQTSYAMIRDDLSAGGWDFAAVATGGGSLNTYGDYLGAVAHPTYTNTWLGVGYILPQGSDPANIVIHQFWIGRRRDDMTRVPTGTVYLPNVTKTLGGPTGWQTPFIVQNVGSAPTDLEVSFYRFGGGTLVAQRRIEGLRPGTSFAEVPNNDADLPDGSQLSVVVRSFGAPIVAVVNEHQGVGERAEALSYGGLASGATRISLPYVAKFVDGWLSTFVVQNLGGATTTATVSLRPASGSAVLLTRTIAPGAAAFVDPSVEAALQRGIEYTGTISSDQPIAAIVNAHNDAAGVTTPKGFSYIGVPGAAPTLAYAPYVAKNAGGRISRVVIENSGTAAAAPSLSFTMLGSTRITSVIGPSVESEASWSADLSTLADGEYALTISGGAFAAVVEVLGATDAMGYTAQSTVLVRSYLPNVTRTLGGLAGWTTPIIVQSAGATGVTLRWYRFADGGLVATTSLTGLSNGQSVRIDPRDLSDLSDGTQYAVVADGIGGPIAAIVTELNYQGGDGAMIYEGFAAAP